jgi:hypothetical protein
MKTKQCLLILILFSFVELNYAQGWCQDRVGVYSVGIGGTSVVALGNGFVGETGGGLSVNISGEYKVQRFVGVGFETGMDAYFSNYYAYYDRLSPHPYAAVGIPLGIKANIHILEACNLDIARTLDVYAGLNVGAGPAIYTGPGGGVFGFIQAGPQVGIRYWITNGIGVFGELGWGATFGNIGFSF